jgi:hypothetical protein
VDGAKLTADEAACADWCCGYAMGECAAWCASRDDGCPGVLWRDSAPRHTDGQVREQRGSPAMRGVGAGRVVDRVPALSVIDAEGRGDAVALEVAKRGLADVSAGEVLEPSGIITFLP